MVQACRTAKQGALDALAVAVPGRPGQSAEQAAEVLRQCDELAGLAAIEQERALDRDDTKALGQELGLSQSVATVRGIVARHLTGG